MDSAVVNVHRCTSGFWKWFRWIQHPKKPLFRHLKLVCSSIGSKVILRAYYVLVHAVNVHRCTLGFWKWFRWIQHPKKPLFRHLKLVYSSFGSKVMLRARMHIKRAQDAKACTDCAHKCFSHVATDQ